VKFRHSGHLVGDISENGPSRDRIDSAILNAIERFGGALDEDALILDVPLNCECFSVTKQRRRNIRHKHAQRWAYAVERA
jgi:hypothetical protein